MLLLYMLTALYLVILPLPANRHICSGAAGPAASFVSFQFIRDMLRETQAVAGMPLTYLRLVTERAFLEAALNIALLVPFGLFLRYYFRRYAAAALILSFMLSLFFEITQVTGLYGIYDCPYRLFDVDDLMLNTAGGMLGYSIAPLLTRFLPDLSRLDENIDLAAKQVGYIHRWVALQLDGIVLLPFLLASLHSGKPAVTILLLLAYYTMMPFLTGGRTIGKWMVRIRLQGRGGRPRLSELLVRYGLLYALLGGMNAVIISGAITDRGWLPTLLYIGAAVVVDIAFAIHVLLKMFRGDKQLFYEKWSGTRHVIMTNGDSVSREKES
ncbi:VanZ family protein [Paenibacillus sepulcri]|uniref:VanZ family protein n=1 Tax=Paenibacillus sepulcri TaxID=359917 RepID=UPI0035EC90A1